MNFININTLTLFNIIDNIIKHLPVKFIMKSFGIKTLDSFYRAILLNSPYSYLLEVILTITDFSSNKIVNEGKKRSFSRTGKS